MLYVSFLTIVISSSTSTVLMLGNSLVIGLSSEYLNSSYALSLLYGVLGLSGLFLNGWMSVPGTTMLSKSADVFERSIYHV